MPTRSTHTGDAGAPRSPAKHRDASGVPDRLLDVHEAAAMLSVKVSTLRQWTYQRRIPFVKLLGRAVRFRESDLRRLIEEWTRPPLRSYVGGRS